MLYSQLKFVQSFAYLWLYIQFSIQQEYESHGRERDMFCPVCEQIVMFYNLSIWQKLQKDIFKLFWIISIMQKPFIFSLFFFFIQITRIGRF